MGKEKKSWWESHWEGCTMVYVKDIKPECLTDEARIKYKDELQTLEEKRCEG